MRCPKCGFISFDHVEECLKCSKNIKTSSENLQGSVFNIAPPSFLRIDDEPQDTMAENVELDTGAVQLDEDDYVDEDIQILVGDEDAEIETDIELGEESSIETDIDMSVEGDDSQDVDLDEEDGIEIDLGQFEKSSEPDLEFGGEEPEELAGVEFSSDDDEINIEVPDELADVSDLAPPSIEEVQQDREQLVSDPADSKGESLELDNLDFDFGMDDLEEIPSPGADSTQETILALDDIDFDDALGGDDSGSTKKDSGASGMDGDLDFELDLGGLSIHKDV